MVNVRLMWSVRGTLIKSSWVFCPTRFSCFLDCNLLTVSFVLRAQKTFVTVIVVVVCRCCCHYLLSLLSLFMLLLLHSLFILCVGNPLLRRWWTHLQILDYSHSPPGISAMTAYHYPSPSTWCFLTAIWPSPRSVAAKLCCSWSWAQLQIMDYSPTPRPYASSNCPVLNSMIVYN